MYATPARSTSWWRSTTPRRGRRAPPWTGTANVAERVAVHGVLGGATEGTPVSGVIATFTDPLPGLVSSNFAATIDGDGNVRHRDHDTGANGPLLGLGLAYLHRRGLVGVGGRVRPAHPDLGLGVGDDDAPRRQHDVPTGSPVAIGAIRWYRVLGDLSRPSRMSTRAAPSRIFSATIDWVTAEHLVAGALLLRVARRCSPSRDTYAAPGTFSVTVHLAEKAPGSAAAGVVSAATVAPVSAAGARAAPRGASPT